MTNPHLDAASVTDLERIEEAISQASRQETMVRLTRFQKTPPNLVGTPVAMFTSILPVSANNSLLNIADVADRRRERARLRYWMRMSYLFWRR
jgi:hypothetical protein